MAQQEVQSGRAEKAAAVVSFTAVKPQILVEAPKAKDAVQFYKAAFGAEEVSRTTHRKRKAEQEVPLILSAELKLAGVTFIVSDLSAKDSATTVKSIGNGVVMCLETEDVEAAINKAVGAGAVADGEVVSGEGACLGERVGKVKDPFGFVWAIRSPGKKCANAEVSLSNSSPINLVSLINPFIAGSSTSIKETLVLEMQLNSIATQINSSLNTVIGHISDLYKKDNKLSLRVANLESGVPYKPTTQSSAKGCQIDVFEAQLNEEVHLDDPVKDLVPGKTMQEEYREVVKKEKEFGPNTNQVPLLEIQKRKQQYDYYRNLVLKANQCFQFKHMSTISHYQINKYMIMPGASPEMTATLFSFGLIYAIYPSPNLEEIKLLPRAVQEALKSYLRIVKQHQIFIRCYSTIAEVTKEKFYPPIHLIRLGTTRNILLVDEEKKQEIKEEAFPGAISHLRSLGYRIIFEELNKCITTTEEQQWVYHTSTNMCIYTSGKIAHGKQKFEQWYDQIKSNKMDNSEYTQKKICNRLKEFSSHKCKYCSREEEDRTSTVLANSIMVPI